MVFVVVHNSMLCRKILWTEALKRPSLVLLVTVCSFSRGPIVFMVLMVRPFLRLMSDFVSIRDPRHLYFFHKSFSFGILNPSLFDSFSVRFPFFSRSGSRLFVSFILVSSVLMKLMSSAYFGSIST